MSSNNIISRGTGKLIIAKNYSIDVDFTVILNLNPENNLRDSIILKTTYINQNINCKDTFENFINWEFTGIDNSGKTITIKGLFLEDSNIDLPNKKGTIIFSISYFESGILENVEIFIFSIPNIFIGYDLYSARKHCVFLDKTIQSFNFKGEDWIIELKATKDGRLNTISAKENNKNVLSTNISVYKRSRQSINIEVATEIIENCLALLGFASGCILGWIKVHGLTKNKIIWKKYQNIQIPECYNLIRPIDINIPNTISNYLKTALKTFNEDIKKADAYKVFFKKLCLSLNELNFPVPFILLGAALEELIGKETNEKIHSILTKEQKNQLIASFESWLKDNIKSEVDDEDWSDLIENIRGKFSALFQRTLFDRIVKYLDSVGLKYDKDWVMDFKKKRDEATHGDYKYHSNDDKILFRMVNLIHCRVLKDLEYKGDYNNWSKSPLMLENFKY